MSNKNETDEGSREIDELLAELKDETLPEASSIPKKKEEKKEKDEMGRDYYEYDVTDTEEDSDW